MTVTYNFRLVSIRTEKPPQLTEYDIIEDYQIFHSSHHLDLFAIFDHEFKMYRCVEFMGQNNLEVDKNFKLYIENYYTSLSDEEKSTPTIY